MNERVIQFRVGVVVLATLIITAIWIVMFTDIPMPWQGRYTIFIKLDRAPGVTVNTPVRKSGVLIGRVKSVEIPDEGPVIVTARIHGDRRLRRNEQCRVRGSLLGDATLEFNPIDQPGLAQELVRDGDSVEGVVVSEPLEMLSNLEGNLTNTVDALGEASTRVAQLAKRVDDLLAANHQQIEQILQKSALALDGITRTTRTLDNIIGDEETQEQLRQGLKELPALLAQAGETMESIQQTVGLANENLENIAGFTEPLGEKGEDLLATIGSTLDNVDLFVAQVLTFAESLNSSEGTLGQLLHNPELYENVNQAVTNVKKISTQLRPILSDVRIFTDKIARDPGRLGVSGALRRRSGIK